MQQMFQKICLTLINKPQDNEIIFFVYKFVFELIKNYL